jgi:hypothetical protein
VHTDGREWISNVILDANSLIIDAGVGRAISQKQISERRRGWRTSGLGFGHSPMHSHTSVCLIFRPTYSSSIHF